MTEQLGVPLTDEVLEAMSKEIKKFWYSFLGQSMKICKKNRSAKALIPYTPPLSLQKKYEKAIRDYSGGKYCQVRQMEEIFNFQPVKPCGAINSN